MYGSFLFRKIIKFINLILFTRPYSWINVTLIATLSSVLSGVDFCSSKFIINLIIGIISWNLGIFFVEYIQRERIVTYSFYLFVLLFAFLGFTLLILNPIVLIFLFLFIFIGGVYSLKTKSPIFGETSFLVRGFFEVILFFGIYFLNANIQELSKEIFFIAIMLYLITASRNLIGDIRDQYKDRFTFSVKHGEKLSYLISSLLLLIAIIISNSFILSFPLIVILILTFLFYRNPGLIHKISLLACSFFLCNYLFFITTRDFYYLVFITDILFIGVLLNLCYDYIQISINKKFYG